MKTSNPKPLCPVKSGLSAAILALGVMVAPSVHATVASNFTIVNHATGQPLSLYDYQGSIILLDFWAYWCGPCNQASADIEPNITQYYRNAGGNNNGVPVTVISISIDLSSPDSENTFIDTYGLELVGDDASGAAYDQFNQGYIPQFAVINGTTNSSNYGTWQVLYSNYGYGAGSTVPTLKSYIDSVQTPAPTCAVTNPVTGAIIPPSDITLGAEIASNGKIIKNVEFYNGTTLLGSTTNTPCSLVWSNAPVGVQSVFVRTYYGTTSSDSAPVNFTVASPLVPKLISQGTNFLLRWTGGAGTFQVQVATNLSTPVWQNYGTAGTNQSLTITAANRAAFFRVLWP